jgi:hypothetical protein
LLQLRRAQQPNISLDWNAKEMPIKQDAERELPSRRLGVDFDAI